MLVSVAHLIIRFSCIVAFVSLVLACTSNTPAKEIGITRSSDTLYPPPLPGAYGMENYVPELMGKRIGLVTNHSALVGNAHLVDTLLKQGVNILKIFAPEHGFRGQADAGEKVEDGRDPRTRLPIFSLYGSQKKPTAESLAGLDILVFDIQDVGVRFYTYISTLHYVMEACAENDLALWILDRPNPNGHLVDGPVLKSDYQSFVGMHPIPVLHGLTVGELAMMINGEQWLPGSIRCELRVIPCSHYTHSSEYELPVPPSPNLPNQRAIYLYPSLCLFEGTAISVGRGTRFPFQVYGHPGLEGDFAFVPEPGPGARHPKLEGQRCVGRNLTLLPLDTLRNQGFTLRYLIDAYQEFPEPTEFFLENNFFEKLAGTQTLRNQLEMGVPASQIRKGWQAELQDYRKLRQSYLLYPE